MKMRGAYNAVAPEFITNSDFVKTVAFGMNKKMWFPDIPEFLMKIIFGEMAEMLLYGSRISSEKLLETGFTFEFTKLKNVMTTIPH